jgi:hypothetical protein
MKRAHEDHVGMKLELLDNTLGKVVKVSETGYRIKRTDGTKITLPLEAIRWTKTNKLLEIEIEQDLTGLICQLRHCGHHSDGVVVKVGKKLDGNNWNFLFSTGCGGYAPYRCFLPVDITTALDKSYQFEIVDEEYIKCDCCSGNFKHKDLELVFIPLKEWHKQAVVCRSCLSVVRPFFNLVTARPSDKEVADLEKSKRVGARELKTFDTHDLVELNSAVQETVSEVSTRHGLIWSETHSLIRPTAMQYVVEIKLPTDVKPEEVPPLTKTVLAPKVSAILKSKMDKKVANK